MIPSTYDNGEHALGVDAYPRQDPSTLHPPTLRALAPRNALESWPRRNRDQHGGKGLLKQGDGVFSTWILPRGCCGVPEPMIGKMIHLQWSLTLYHFFFLFFVSHCLVGVFVLVVIKMVVISLIVKEKYKEG